MRWIRRFPPWPAPYEKGREYRYGKIKITLYRARAVSKVVPGEERRPVKTAIYPGSFDPITLGHLNIIKRAAVCFDKLIVCVMVNSDKAPHRGLFTPAERAELIRKVVWKLPNVEVDWSTTLLAEYAREKKACTLVKGLRAVSDYENEMQMALLNRKLNPRLDTMLMPSSAKYTYISSSVVKEMARYGADLSDFVPREIIGDINERMRQRRGE